MVFLFFQLNYCLNTTDKNKEVEKVVKSAFRLAFEKKYDSLSLIMPEHFFENITEESQSIEFGDLYRVVKLTGDIDKLKFKTSKELIHGMDGYVVMFYPNPNLYNKDSLRLFKIDSIRFEFITAIGTNRINQFKTFGPIPILKGIIR